MTSDTAELCRRLRSVPLSLQARKQWLLWRFISYEGDTKPRKVPFYVSGRKRRGAQGSVEDRDGLATFDIALTHLERGHYDGLGFAFLPGDGLIGIDIDGAIDPESGVISERCQAIIEACGSYTELSPSGKGVHIICEGETEIFKDNSIGVEVFCGAQFFTFTAKHWSGSPREVRPLDEAVLKRLKATVKAARQAKKPAKAKPAGDLPNEPSDFDRVNAAGLALLDVWVPSLFPDARKQSGSGTWRVKSKDLGRDLQEDLSLHRDGIMDFGTEQGMTPIDVVITFKGKTPREALVWLAGAIGLQLTKPKGKNKLGGASAQPTDGGGSTPPAGSAGEGEADPGEPEPLPWREQLLRTAEGGKKDCRENVYLSLVHHPKLHGLVGYDEFAHVVMKLRKPPWDSPAGEWTTNDDYFLGFWFAQHERLIVKAEGTLVAGVAMAAFHARYNPLHDYLNSLPAWDGVPRLAYWLHECLGAEDSEYTKLVGTWFIMGMVKRALEPGCQMDYMVVLEGLQGKQKSTALRTLVGRDEWFADTPIRIGDKDAMLSLAGKWLYEVGELDSFNKAEVTAVKQYVSSRIDRVREPFARRPADRKRSGVFGGSTNQSEYFKDPTGARRFWPVACDGEIQLAKLAGWRDLLFAEAKARLVSAEIDERRYYPTREETDRLLVPQQERREIVDPWFERLATWLDSRVNYGDAGTEVCDVKHFTSYELLTKALNVPLDRIDGGRQMATRVGIAMHKLKWIKRRDSDGARVWRYWRPDAVKQMVDATGGPDASGNDQEEPPLEL